MPSRFIPPSISYPVEATCASLVERLRVNQEIARAAIEAVNESSRESTEAGGG